MYPFFILNNVFLFFRFFSLAKISVSHVIFLDDKLVGYYFSVFFLSVKCEAREDVVLTLKNTSFQQNLLLDSLSGKIYQNNKFHLNFSNFNW